MVRLSNVCKHRNRFNGIYFVDLFTAQALKAGKEKVATVAPGLFACKKIYFQHSFYGAQQVKVLASIGHTVKSSLPRNSATLWVESVTTGGFKVCVLEYGKGSNESAEVNWIAFRSTPSGSQFGSITFNYLTTGTQCKRIGLIQVRTIYFLIPTPFRFVHLSPRSLVPLSLCHISPFSRSSLISLSSCTRFLMLQCPRVPMLSFSHVLFSSCPVVTLSACPSVLPCPSPLSPYQVFPFVPLSYCILLSLCF